MHLLTNHARVLICIARMPGCRLHELAGAVGLTERATHRIVDELVEAGYITRHRMGKRRFYEVHPDTPLQDGELPPAGAPAIISTVGDLLAVALRRS